MDTTVLVIFLFVYLGMILGKIPGLALDRTGIALLGAIALLAVDRIDPRTAWQAVDVPTIGLLLGLMVVSAQFRLGGFYTSTARRLASSKLRPELLLAVLIAVVGILSALLANDIVCLAMAPILVEGCAGQRLDPLPFLLALACAANVGSAATLIGNPQNMLIGQTLHLSFGGYLLLASVPALSGLFIVWWIIKQRVGTHWHKAIPVPQVEAPELSPWQTAKGLFVLGLLLLAFLFARWPREVLALAAAGLLLASRKMASRHILGLVDWQLLLLFIGLFIVNHVLQSSGMLAEMLVWLQSAGVNLRQPAWLFTVAVLLSNLVSNVPATMLLLPAASHPLSGPILALATTLAGNLLIVGSIANIIVVDQAGRLNIKITWLEHARVGVPVTILSLAFTAGWLWLWSAK
jgi:Na+/H+ antiporter NhaD/arsenite permease-like protein